MKGRRRNPLWRKKREYGKYIVIMTAFVIVLASAGAWKIHTRDSKSWSWTTGDKTIVIDAGHGGVDPGAVGKNSLEKDITLEVSKRLRMLIEQAGGKAVMVRETDVDLGTSQGLLRRKREDLAQRLQLALDNEADVYISIHGNSFPNERLSGPQVFYFSESPDGKRLAQAIQGELNIIANGKRIAKGNQDLFILKKASQAAVTVEVGFLSNPEEETKLNDPNYQQQLAMAIYRGISGYFGDVK